MLSDPRRLLLRFNAAFLVLAALGGWFQMDFPAGFSGTGPLAPLIAHERSLAIGFVEAHGLALILGVLLWFLPPQRSSHMTAVAIHALLGVSNIVFWQLFVATGTLVMGWVTTSVHLSLVVLQAIAAVTRPRT